MKIEIQNLGPIHHFEFDLEKDLHLLYGENNVGKSFAVNVVYCLMKNLSNLSQNDNPKRFLRNISGLNESDKVVYEKLMENVGAKVDIKSEVLSQANTIIEKILLPSIKDSLLNTFQSLLNLIGREEEKILIIIKSISIEIKIRIDFNEFLAIEEIIYKEEINVKLLKRGSSKFGLFGNNLMGLYFFNALEIFFGEDDLRLPSNYFFDGAIGFYFVEHELAKLTHFFHKIYCLPSSRSGLYQNLASWGPMIAELSKHRFQVNKKIELPTLTEPVSDYFKHLSLIVQNNKKKPSWAAIAREIEDLIEGEIQIDTDSRRIYYLPKNSKLKLEVSISASMVGELAPLILFLREVISLSKFDDLSKDELDDLIENGDIEAYVESDEIYKKNRINILIIEEPEAHLHPKVQVQLMEIFAELTKHNVKVILTSHSNYMFNKLSNMLLKKEIAPEKVGIYHMVMTEKGSVVATDMEATTLGIEDHNFAEVAKELYQERLETYDLLNEDPDAVE